MSTVVTLFSDHPDFAPLWRGALERVGLSVRSCAPHELGEAAEADSAAIIDGGCAVFGNDEDELLTAVGFLRAAGALPVVHIPERNGPGAADGEVEDVIAEMCAGLVGSGDDVVGRLAASVARRLDRERTRRFEFVTVSPRDKEILAIFGNGGSVLLKRPVDERDDGSAIVAIELAEDAATVELGLESGAQITLRASHVAPRDGHHSNGNGTIPIDGARLGRRLRELRLEAGLTQAELARRTGIHRPNIARVEAGRHTPSLETLARLATAIGVPTTRVLSED